MEGLVKSTYYDRLTDKEKAKAIRKEFEQARRQARDELRLSTRRKQRLDTPTDRSRERAIKRIGDMGRQKMLERLGR